jgi:mannose-6-phosphate isomerase
MEVENRPWGYYKVLLDVVETKVKVISVNPNQRLSYQSHNKRREQWTVTYGTLTVVLDDKEIVVNVGESIYIPLGAKHRAWNKTDKPVRFIEVQTGTYFGEDDIIRYDDDYARS